MYRSIPQASYPCLSDEALIQQVYPQQPDQCFESLYNHYVGKVYQRCLSMTKDEERAQDFTQDIFIKVCHKLDAFQERSRFSTWLYSIAYNYRADQLGLGKRLSSTSLEVVFGVEHADSLEYLREETLRVIKRTMNSLSAQDRSLLHLKYEDGLSIADIAQLQALNESIVKMRLMRSRQKIRRLADPLLG